MSAGRSGKSESAAVGGGVRSQSRWARCEAGRCEFQHHVGSCECVSASCKISAK